MSDEKFELPTTGGLSEPPINSAEVASDFKIAPGYEPKDGDAVCIDTITREIKPATSEPQKDQNIDKPKPEEPRQTKSLTAIPIGPDGKVVARDNAELLRLCHALVIGEGVPKRFDNPTKLFAAIQFVRDLKLPDTAIRQVAPIEGVMSIFGDLPLALVQSKKELTYFQEKWFDKEYNIICFENKNLTDKIWGSVCLIERSGKGVQSFSFTLDEATQMGKYPAEKWEWVDNKKTGKKIPDPKAPWMTATKMMLRYRARAIALKSLFADSINGVSIAEYDFDEIEPARDVTTKPASLNDKVADVLSKDEANSEQGSSAEREAVPVHPMPTNG